LSKDLQLIYGNQKVLHYPSVWEEVLIYLESNSSTEKTKIISLPWSLQFGHNVDILMNAYVDIIKECTYSRTVRTGASVEKFGNKRLQRKVQSI
jgi:hypothetical protein